MPPQPIRKLETDNPAFRGGRGSTGPANPGAARDGADDPRWSALHLAAIDGDELAVRWLLGGGAAVDLRVVPDGGCSGATPLHCAVAGGSLAVVDALLEAGADPAARDEAGYTPLLLAAERGDLDVVKRLLRAGADPGSECGDVSPLAAARRGPHHRVVALLKQVCRTRPTVR
jgi:hypothetical protein